MIYSNQKIGINLPDVSMAEIMSVIAAFPNFSPYDIMAAVADLGWFPGFHGTPLSAKHCSIKPMYYEKF